MLSSRTTRILTVAGFAAWACALPEQTPPPDGTGGTGNPTGGSTTGGSTTGGSSTGGSTTGGSSTGGSTTGGSSTGGSTTGGSSTGGSTTGGSTSGGAGSSTGGGAGSSTGGTMSGAGGRGGAGAGGAGAGGTAGTAAGMGGTMAGAGMGGGGTAGSAGGSVLVHRYSFDGTGTTATDSIGTAHGTITGGSQSGGAVTLSGSEQYVTLPNTLLNGLSAATFEAWVSWTGSSDWQRIFDFGNNDGAEGDQGAANETAAYIFLTTRASGGASTSCQGGTASAPRVAITGNGPMNESCGLGTATFPTGTRHVAVTIDENTLALYIDGAQAGGAVTPAVPLSSISSSHNWLGRSQFEPDSEFAGTIREFRVYGTARTASQIQASYMNGENMVPTQ